MLLVALSARAAETDKPQVVRFEKGISIALPPPQKPLDLPAGYYFPDEAYAVTDAELKRLQQVEIDKKILEVNASRAVIIVACVSALIGAGLTAAVFLSR